MTKAEIIAELRRSAVEDESPWVFVGEDAFLACVPWKLKHQWMADAGEDLRTFFLLVACALESE